MKSLRLTDIKVTLHVRPETPPVPVKTGNLLTANTPDLATKDAFRKAWRRAAEHYGVTLSWQGEDEAILNRLLTRYGKEELGNRAREFWLREAKPLIEGEYHRSMVLFASKIEGLSDAD